LVGIDGKWFREFGVGFAVFTYPSLVHDVLQVNATSYANCITANPIKSYHSGNDSVLIVANTTLFICGSPGHCGLGQKVNITTNVTTIS
jgi:hypothetical protein